MADKKFSELDLVGSLTGTEILPVIQEGLPKRTTVADVVANYVLKSGDTMTGQLTSQIVAPSADSTYTLGTSSLYWKETYTDKLFLNSTATLDGSTAGEIKGTGIFTADNIKRGTGFPNGVVTANVGTVYIDTDVTNGASSWIKKSGTGNTGWQVLEGDTGWRNVTNDYPTIMNSASGMTGLLFRRVGERVDISMAAVQFIGGNTGDKTVIPLGFRSTAFNYYTIFTGGVLRTVGANIYNITTTESQIRASISYLATDAWPATLPGVSA